MRTPTAALLIKSPSLCFFLSIVVMGLLPGCTIGRESKHPAWKTATGAEQYERLMWQAIRDKHWAEVEARLAPTFVGITPAGQKLDRDGWIQYWKAGQVKKFSMADLTAQPNGADMTVSYAVRLGDSRSSLRVMSVWQQVERGWILTATSMTPLAPDDQASSAK